jgi:ATP synthase protein I
LADKRDKPLFRHFLQASSVGLNLVFSTFVGLAIGYGLDHLFHTSPWLMIIFTILGIVAGFRELVRMAKKQASDDDEGGSDKDSGPDKKDI